MSEGLVSSEISWKEQKELYIKSLLGPDKESVNARFILDNFVNKLQGWKALDTFIQKLELTGLLGEKLVARFWEFNMECFDLGTVDQNMPLAFAKSLLASDKNSEEEGLDDDPLIGLINEKK